MKRIINIILAASALLAFAPISFAQTQAKLTKSEKDRLYYKDSGTGIAYSKTIEAPNPQGIYKIYLESFVTGEVTMKYQDAPADIILVLDVSTSMSDSRGTKTLVTAETGLTYNMASETVYLFHYDRSDTNNSSRPNNFNGVYRSFKEICTQKVGDRYYLYIASYGSNSNHYHYLTKDADGVISGYTMTNSLTPPGDAAYATSPDDVIVTFPGTADAQGGENANGIGLDRALYTGASRMSALKEAVCAFIDEIDENDRIAKEEDGTTHERPHRLGNRIALITFSAQNNHNTIFGLTKLDETSTTIDDLKADVNGIIMSQGTYPGPALNDANTLLNGIDADRKKLSSRTVVFFTDGEPADGQDDAAIGNSHTAKATHNAIVYSVGMFDSKPAATSDIARFMTYVSSNYPDATSMGSPGTGGDNGYSFDASDPDASLTDIFRKIAQESGGSGNASLGSAVTAVDVVSASFVLPEGASNNIKIYTAPVTGIMEGITYADTTYTVEVDGETVERHWLKFGNPIPIKTNTATYEVYDDDGNLVEEKDVDNDITFTLTPTDNPNTIRVNGFDYSGNWCGTVTDLDGNITGYHGHKVIIEIPIKMSPDAVGGPHVETNAPGSGIYINGESDTPLVRFESPDVSLPVNIFVQKNGLKEGESAKFTIERTPAPASSSSTWEPVTSVFVTRSKGSTTPPVTKVMGLPSTNNDATVEYVYRVREEGWSWSYTPEKESILSTEIITNPFIFNNTEKEDIDYRVRHAESKATNTFHPDKTKVKYDDSKDRKTN